MAKTRPLFSSAYARDANLNWALGVKLSIPRLSQTTLERSHLLEMLNLSVQVPLTVVSAPAGYGKTTTVAQWAIASAHPVSWISLGPEDNNPSAFFAYLINAIKAADPDSLEAAIDGAHGIHEAQEIMWVAVNAMSLATKHFFLVLDDFHSITNGEILQAITFLINHLPSQAHLVIVSRTIPTLHLGRLRASDSLREITAADLAFSTDEALAFRSASGLDIVDDAQWADLSARTEGWIAGLQLVRLSLHGQDAATVERFVAAFDGRLQEIDEYLLEEVISGLPADLRFFMLRSSLLPFLTPELCNEALNTDRSPLLLRELRQRGLFVVSLDRLQLWLRYHHLFADALQRRLADEANDDEIAAIHYRASEWLGHHGHPEQAISHAVACQRWDLAVSLARHIVTSLPTEDRMFFVRRWLDQLPREVVMADPELRYTLLWSLAMSTSFTESKDAAALIGSDDSDPTFPARAHTVRMITSYAIGDVDGMGEHAQAVLAHAPRHELAPRMYANIVLATARYFVGAYRESEAAMTEVRQLAEIGAEPWMRNRGEVRYLDSLCLQGLLDDAVTLARQLIHNSSAAPTGGDAQLFWFLASIHLERNDLELVEQSLARAHELVESTESETWTAPILITHAMFEWARGNMEAAHEKAEQASESARSLGNPNFVQRADALRSMMWIAMGQHILAERWLATANLNLNWVREFNQPYPALAAVRLFAARGDSEAALVQLNTIIDDTRTRRRTGDLVRLHAMRAGILARLDASDDAAAELAIAIDLGARGGFVRSFLDEGSLIAKLFNHPLIREHPHRRYAQYLKQGFDRQQTGLSPVLAEQVEALSVRELEVLRLVSEGRSNRQISGQLYISEPTVKKHISNILGKLDVLNRTQAVSIAREMGVLT